MATVHGPRHLTAVNYGTRRMVLRSAARQRIPLRKVRHLPVSWLVLYKNLRHDSS